MITVKELSFTYPKEQELFDKLSLKLSPGSITGLLGTNGAGKTTLLKLLSGLLAKSSGSIKVNDFSPHDRNVDLLKEIYFLPEEYFLPHAKVSSYLKAYSGFYPRFNIEKFNSILKDFNLTSDAKLQKLSHGQKKKFLVSFALATNCSIMIFDEPTNGLDIPSKSLFRKILAGSIDDNQLVIISTHQVKDVETLIDNIVVLKGGKVVFHENTSTISEKLVFSSGRDIHKDSAIYSEAAPGGYKSIFRQTNGHSSDIDIEILFNAINSGKKILTDYENE